MVPHHTVHPSLSEPCLMVDLRRHPRVSGPYTLCALSAAAFHFSKLHFSDLLICFSAGLISILWFELLKMFNGQKKHGRTELNTLAL